MSDRGKLRVLLAACLVAVLLTGCVPGATRGDDRFAGVDRPVASPSGTYRAVIVEQQGQGGLRLLVPTIQDASGATVFSDTGYAARHRLLVMWQGTGDVLWVYSGDVGTSRIDQAPGAWRKVTTRDGMPDDVRKAFGQ